ncbi:MAG TPA: hypothetical protein VG425_19285, partial [Casimicrobiaceae bacterium]|nr:hypothetical protein [Casimicrobiaceae bacterium]
HLQYARSLQRSNLKPEKYPQSIVATGRPIKKLLEAEHVTLADRSVNDVSFYARAGEITGIAGLSVAASRKLSALSSVWSQSSPGWSGCAARRSPRRRRRR